MPSHWLWCHQHSLFWFLWMTSTCCSAWVTLGPDWCSAFFMLRVNLFHCSFSLNMTAAEFIPSRGRKIREGQYTGSHNLPPPMKSSNFFPWEKSFWVDYDISKNHSMIRSCDDSLMQTASSAWIPRCLLNLWPYLLFAHAWSWCTCATHEWLRVSWWMVPLPCKISPITCIHYSSAVVLKWASHPSCCGQCSSIVLIISLSYVFTGLISVCIIPLSATRSKTYVLCSRVCCGWTSDE